MAVRVAVRMHQLPSAIVSIHDSLALGILGTRSLEALR